MNGIHDMGGMHGFGPVVVEAAEPAFHAPWEGRVWAMVRATVGRRYHLDELRHSIERIPASSYLEAGYYERWLAALESVLVARGVLSQSELATGRSAGPAPAVGLPADTGPAPTPRFRPGDRVRARNLNPRGHTRLPRYARGRRGTVRGVRGPFLLPDVNAHRPGAPLEPCYEVEFASRELWGDDAEAGDRDRVCVDLFESYLEEGWG